MGVALLSSPSTAPAVLTCRTSSHSHRDKLPPIMSDRLSQISSHISSGNYPKGLLNGEVAIITGAAQGIGRSAALQFAKEGAKVVVSDLDEKKAQAVVDEIKKAGGDAIAVGGDVTNPQFPKDLVSKTFQKYGKINHIINNASSPSGLHGNVGQVNYAVAKAGVVGLSKTIAKEWGSFGVRCNTVAYGYILTRLTQAKEDGASITVGGKQVALGIPTGGASASKAGVKSMPDIPLGRAGNADEAAAAMLFLASPLASYISGHTLEVTGGRGI